MRERRMTGVERGRGLFGLPSENVAPLRRVAGPEGGVFPPRHVNRRPANIR